MTILQLISSEGFYGAESMLVALSQALAKLRCNLIVGVFHDARQPHVEIGEFARKRGLPVKMIRCGGRWDWSSVKELKLLLEEYGVDVLHAHGYKADLYGYAAAWSRDIALISTCHNWPSKKLLMRAYAALDRAVLRKFDGVATPSPLVADILGKSGVDSAKLKWIDNGVDIDRFYGAEETLRQELGLHGEKVDRRPIVGFVGRMVHGKGGSFLMHAARQVVRACPQVHFAMVGEGPSRQEWEGLAASLGIGSSNVTFTGGRSDMPGVYASLDMLVLPSLDEAMPMCLLEAMAAGKPVIASNVGAVSKLVIPGLTGYLLEAGDVNAIAASILDLVRIPGLAAMLGKQGHQQVVQSFSAEAMAREYLTFYEQAIESRWTSGRSESAVRN